MTNTFRVNGKINLFLHVQPNKSFHQQHSIKTLMLPVWTITDELQIISSQNNCNSLCVTGNFASDIFSAGNSIISKFLTFLVQQFKLTKYFIFVLIKNLPIGSGLGTLSALLVKILIFYNKTCLLGLSQSQQTLIINKFTSDGIFFLYNSPLIMSNNPLHIQFFSEPLPFLITILLSKTHKIYAQQMYHQYDILTFTTQPRINVPVSINQTIHKWWQFFQNDLTNAFWHLMPHKYLEQISQYNVNPNEILLLNASGTSYLKISYLETFLTYKIKVNWL